ncbi:MAG TPA: hypothetical protein H9707_01970 [Candidatus Butyricicoccus avicola]|nr:hypothetical protein [Candidatus Butyricicoccus avicola]
MKSYWTPAMLGEGWNMLKYAERNQYFLVTPQTPHVDMRVVLIEIMANLLAGKHIVMLAESRDPASLNVLRTLSGEARILKRGEETALYAELDGIPTAEALCTLPQSGKFRLRLAGFDGAVPGELIFSGLMDANCPADVVLDCTYLADRPALGISVCNEALDEQALVDLARNAVTERGEALRVDFAS